MSEALLTELERARLLIEQQRKEIERLKIEVNRATLVATYALWERSNETELRTMAEGLMVNYHKHAKHTSEKWIDCMHETCVKARLLFDHAREAKIEVTSFGLAVMQDYALKFTYGKNDEGKLDHVKAWLIKRAELPANAPQDQGRIVLQ